MDILRYLLGPVLLHQGIRLKKRIPRLKAPEYPRAHKAGKGAPLSILFIGDSSGEGVGANTFEQTLIGQLLEQLPGYELNWWMLAKSGFTTHDALRDLGPRKPRPFDVAITILGVNDVTSSISVGKWLKQTQELHQRLQEKWHISKLVVCGVPPMWGFPAMPHPLRWYIGRKAKKFDKKLQRYTSQQSSITYLALDFCQDVSHMAEDGFHPGPEIYKLWAQEIIKLLKIEVPPSYDS